MSSETCGRLKDGTMPSHCNVAIMVLPRIGLPLSECRRWRWGPRTCLSLGSSNPETSLTVALMPWKETDAVKQRVKFLLEWEARWYAGDGRTNFAALCRELGVSRQVGYDLVALGGVCSKSRIVIRCAPSDATSRLRIRRMREP